MTLQPMSARDGTPSKEAMEAVEALWSQKYTDKERMALAFDSFAAAAVKREREECAKVCDEFARLAFSRWERSHAPDEATRENSARDCSAVIRKRSATEGKE